MVTPRQSPSGQLIDPIVADTYSFVDDFDCGPASAGLISTSGINFATGAGNWTARSITNSGSFQLGYGSVPAQDPDHPGQLRFFCGNTTNDAVVVVKNQNGSTTGQIFSEKIDELEFIFLLQNTGLLTTKVQFFASTVDANYNPTSNSMILSYDTSDAVSGSNFVARVSGFNPVNTGVGPTPNTSAWWKARFKRRTDQIEMYINDALEATFAGTLPTGQVATGFRVQTLAAGNRFVTIDRISLQSKPLNR